MFERSLQTGGRNYDETAPQSATIKVYHDREHASHVCNSCGVLKFRCATIATAVYQTLALFVIDSANKMGQHEGGVIAKIAMTAKIAKIEKPSVNLLILQ